MISSIASAARNAVSKTTFSFTIAGLALAAAIVASAPVQAQDTQSLVNRLDRLERDMGSLSRQVYSGGGAPKGAGGGPSAGAAGGAAPSGDYAARLDQRISDLEGQMSQLTGNVETLMHSNTELQSQIERMNKDNDLRFKDLEGRGGGGSAGGASASLSATQDEQSPTRGAPPANMGTLNQRDIQAAPKGGAAPAPQQRASLPAGSPQQQYDYAYGLLDKARSEADYNNASQAFKDFLDKNPNGPLASAARYWMGQSHFVNKDYQGAAAIFLDGYQKDQKGQKAPDTLLKLGMSLTNLDKKKEACATFDKLSKDFPSQASGFRNLPAERKRAGCA